MAMNPEILHMLLTTPETARQIQAIADEQINRERFARIALASKIAAYWQNHLSPRYYCHRGEIVVDTVMGMIRIVYIGYHGDSFRKNPPFGWSGDNKYSVNDRLRIDTFETLDSEPLKSTVVVLESLELAQADMILMIYETMLMRKCLYTLTASSRPFANDEKYCYKFMDEMSRKVQNPSHKTIICTQLFVEGVALMSREEFDESMKSINKLDAMMQDDRDEIRNLKITSVPGVFDGPVRATWTRDGYRYYARKWKLYVDNKICYKCNEDIHYIKFGDSFYLHIRANPLRYEYLTDYHINGLRKLRLLFEYLQSISGWARKPWERSLD